MKTVKEIGKILTKNTSTRGKKVVFFIASFIATGCFVGKIKYAPGTFGSLLAIIFCPYYVLLPQVWQIIILCSLLALGTISTHIYLIKINDPTKDPKEVVIDEIIAIFLMTWMCQIAVPASEMKWQHFLSIFVLFRFFDVLKPYPICWVDKHIHGAKGIILDDILASIAGWLCFCVSA